MEGEKFAKESGVTLAISGINVKFPVKPYPSQLSMMSMIIRGLEKRQHCLLESPTGSGKSLALLCSALAWQQAQYEKPDMDLITKLKLEAEKESPPCTCGRKSNCDVADGGNGPTTSKYFAGTETGGATSVIDLCTPENEDDDFKEPQKPAKERKSKPKHESPCPACSIGKEKEPSEEVRVKRPRVPKIWFGTRTHKQIAQIAKELGRTSYDSARMTILSSRQHSCIHPSVMKSSNKNEECRDLRRGTHTSGAKCAFYQNVHRMKHHDQLMCAGMGSAWDLEELLGLGNTIKACPFYSARELVSSSNIIFCPYNYLIDPLIRSQMQINPNNQIIILDEAHNIEDSAREAGSFTLSEADLGNTTADLEFLINDGVKIDDHRPLHFLCMRIGQWMNEHSRNLKPSAYEMSSEVWYGRDIIAHLQEWGISEVTLPLLEGNFSAATDLGEEDIETAKLLHSSSQATLGGLFNVLRYLMADGNKYCDDYRITIIRQSVFGPAAPKRTREGWVTLQKKSRKHFVTNLHFWCLNPAVAFNDLSKAHCIILTSGTLSPMSSFSSELGLSFPIQLEANHVIQDSQVWVGSIGRGPRGLPLEATYKNTDKFEFQDELGELVNRICHVVPYGVLCFFSSYSMLQRLEDRWKTTGLWSRMHQVKVIICEPRSSNKEEFDSLLQSFYDAVQECSTPSHLTGALLLAVCRGKVSEGLDFADNNARAVITVGIPFPSIKDKQVELKRKYNDIHRSRRGLLSGAQWYEIQAYRAMNQALGRCIRHKNDWGALIIVDERFCKNPEKYSKGLSKWVRQKMRPQVNYEGAISNIIAFMQAWSSKQGGTMLPNEALSPGQKQPVALSSEPEELSLGESTPRKEYSKMKPTFSLHSLHEDKVETVSSKMMSPEIKSVKSQHFTFSPRPEQKELQTPQSQPSKGPNTLVKPEPEKSEKSKLKAVETKRSEAQNSLAIKNDFSADEINISSDEDFQTALSSKTPKHSNKKIKEKNLRDSCCKIFAVPVESQSTNLIIVDKPSPEEDLFDCTIPPTPEKQDLTIIPESPASTKKMLPEPTGKTGSKTWQALDFSNEQPAAPTSSRKRKSSSSSHLDVSTPFSKQKDSSSRKQFQDEIRTGLEEQTAKELDEVLMNEDSGELLPRSRRRARVKNSATKTQQSPVTNIKCKSCKTLLHMPRQNLEAETFESKFLSLSANNGKKKVKSSCKVYIVDIRALTAGKEIELLVHRNQGLPVELNSYWCSEERRCYQAYKCSNCAQLVAYCITSDSALHHKLIFPCKFVEVDLE